MTNLLNILIFIENTSDRIKNFDLGKKRFSIMKWHSAILCLKSAQQLIMLFNLSGSPYLYCVREIILFLLVITFNNRN